MKMKRILMFSAIVALASIIACGQQNDALISFKNSVYDFGTIKEVDGVVSYSFEFTNSGKAPLIIQRAVSACDCISIEWPKEPLAPGAVGIIKVSFNPKNRFGAFDHAITVYSNTKTITAILQIKGDVLEKQKSIEEIYSRQIGLLRFKNPHLSMDRMLTDQVKTDTLDFINLTEEPVKVGCELSGLSHLNVKFVPETVKPKGKGLMIVTYDASKRNDWGFVIDRFNLIQNDKTEQGPVVSVSANIEENFSSLTDEQRINAPKIEFASTSYDFKEIDEGQLVETDFTFTNKGKTDLIIRKIKASCGCTTVDPADKVIKPGKSSSFKASIKTSGFSGHISKSISIITNDPTTPIVVLRVSGIVNPLKK